MRMPFPFVSNISFSLMIPDDFSEALMAVAVIFESLFFSMRKSCDESTAMPVCSTFFISFSTKVHCELLAIIAGYPVSCI